MFCKKCGKEIAEDSSFCKYCGAKQDIDVVDEISRGENEVKAKVEVFDGHKHEKEAKKQKSKSSIANEIVSIGKLMLVALLLWGVYMVGFDLYRSNDRKPSPGLPFGSSCYDPPYITGHYILDDADAEKEFMNMVAFEKRDNLKHRGEFFIINGERIPYSSFMGSFSAMSEEEKAKWKEEQINKGRAEWDDNLNSIREWGYKDELKGHLWWSILIILCSLLVGRYVYMAIKWVNHNKSE